MSSTSHAVTNEIHAVIETNFGKIKIKLYNDTPLHRDNFVKAVKAGAFDNVLFHRVIKDFMIQGGDISTMPDSAKAKRLSKEFGTDINAEILYPTHFHKKGVIAAAREGDDVNPEKKSSATQFYIVVGKIFNDSSLNLLEKNRYEQLKQSIFKRLQGENSGKIKELYRAGDRQALSSFRDSLISLTEKEAETEKSKTTFTEEQRKAYKEMGGTPHLDGNYTVFGEVTEGMEVVEKIQALPTDTNDKPLSDVRMKIKLD